MLVSIKENGTKEYSMVMERCYFQMELLKKAISNLMFIKALNNKIQLLLKAM